MLGKVHYNGFKLSDGWKRSLLKRTCCYIEKVSLRLMDCQQYCESFKSVEGSFDLESRFAIWQSGVKAIARSVDISTVSKKRELPCVHTYVCCLKILYHVVSCRYWQHCEAPSTRPSNESVFATMSQCWATNLQLFRKLASLRVQICRSNKIILNRQWTSSCTALAALSIRFQVSLYTVD